MTQPEALSRDEPLYWSVGKGTDVWEMFCAAIIGDLAIIKLLLDNDNSLIRCAYDYRTPLYFAVRENQLQVAAYLLDRGANPVNSGTPDTLIEIARDRGYLQMSELLEVAINKQKGPLLGEEINSAIRSRNLKKVQDLLARNPELVHARDEGNNQPIHWAVMTRQPDMIDELLAAGADINAQRLDGARPLQLTNGDYSYRGWRDVPKDTVATPTDIFRHLISCGAYLDIYMASLTGNITRVRELLDKDPKLVNGVSDYITYYAGTGSPIQNAAAGGHTEVVRLLLERGADPNLPEEGIAPRGRALYSAVYNKHRDVIKVLLEHGAYPNVEVESSADTLSIAISHGDQSVVDLLCSYGAARAVHLLAYMGDIQTAAAIFAINPELANDPYALENAAGQGHDHFVRLILRYQPDLPKRIAVGVKNQGPQDAVKTKELTGLLFQHGMDPNLPNWLGITPLHRFAERGDIENATLFIDNGANVNVIDEQLDSTPLGWAAKFGKTDMAKFLLKKGADANLPSDKPWALPVSWATRRGHKDIADILSSHAGKA